MSKESAGGKSWVIRLKIRLQKFAEDFYSGEITYKRLSGKLINAAKIFIVSSRKFMLDDCFTKASSIAYTTIISLIPTLTVGLTFYSIFAGVSDKKEELFRRVTIFMVEHNIKLNIDPIIESISSLIDNAGKIGGIGTIIVVFTATAVLRTLEKSLNDVWKVEKQRSIFLKVIYYWAALTLGPIMLITGTTVATHLSSIFAAPNYLSAFAVGDTLWVTGHKANISSTGGDMSRINAVPAQRIDFENQSIFEYDAASKTFRELEYRVEPGEFEKTEFTDIQFIGRMGWAVGRNGIILLSGDGGASWQLEKWGSFGFRDIHMLTPKRGFIAADSGYLFRTVDGGESWQAIEFENFSSNLNSIAFHGGTGVITTDRGGVITTYDAGKTWNINHLPEAKRKNRWININRAFLLSDYNIWVVGDEGLILNSTNGGRSWDNHRFLERNYMAVNFISDTTGFIGGEKGTILITEDGGEKWTRLKVSSPRINDLVAFGPGIVAVGENGTVLNSDAQGRRWQGSEGGSILEFLLNFFAPFVFIWLLFLLTYIIMPNTKVPFKPAAIGASFTGAVWVIFILLFIVYIKSFASGTFAIYGGLAAIPLFLLMVYSSALIILYGAEIAYTLMHPHTYRNLKKALAGKQEYSVFYGIAILHYIYANFEKGKGPAYFKDLLKLTTNKSEEVDYHTALFLKEKYIIETGDGGYLPSNSSKNIVIADVVDLIHDVGMVIPAYAHPESLKKYFGSLFGRMQKSNRAVLDGITLAMVIDEAR
ncbi:MAG TPA: YhjD/YihY/BrkB family envelope integrity protein [Spirochaetota bacterium]|nr:YhjD/YihY/BrkB family envelope integrity protein [Spirochaetota bacterium]